jgi:F5/8 type C domain-containing protein/chitobiase/beta-hexosaminidase-like protein
MAPSYVPIQLEPSDHVIGAQLCAWEMSGDRELAALRPRLPALAERTWLSSSDRTFEDFQACRAHADRLFQQLICPVRIETRGLLNPDYAGPIHNRENWFEDTLTLELIPTRKRIELRCTLDGSEPGPSSLRPRKPITLRETTSLKVRAFSRAGEPLGYAFRVVYEHHPVRARLQGLITHTPHDRPARARTKFGGELKAAFESATGGGIHYTLDGSDPGAFSPLYSDPLRLTESGVISARVFEENGRPRGEIWRRSFEKVDQQPNPTSFAPVAASGFFGGHKPENAVDGIVDRADTWRASRDGAGWLQVDLGKPLRLDGVRLYFYWNRWHDPVRYRLELSEDGISWRMAADMRRNRRRALPEGFHHTISPAPVRFLRVTVQAAEDRSPELVEIRIHTASGEPVS